MIVMGGIVGSGIFVNPHVVAQRVHTPLLIVGAWVAGGVDRAAGRVRLRRAGRRRPEVGGQYAYLRDAYHPSVAFLYGWALLLVIQTGGMAAVAVTFARYFREPRTRRWANRDRGRIGLALLTAVNCLGVRSGSSVQSASWC
jgi:APA family basic amino acid/polyamine antiporter